MNGVRAVFFVFIVVFALIIHRLFIIQVFSSENYIPVQPYLKVEKVLSLRGQIYDVNGNPLAVNEKVYTIYADTKKLKKEDRIRKTIQSFLKIKSSTMSAILEKGQWQRLKKNVSIDVKDRIAKYYPKYLNIEPEWKRSYPEGSMAASILGFVGKDEVGNPKGYVGVEGAFEQELRGLPSVEEAESDMRGISFIGGASEKAAGRPGLAIRLTIDRNVQKILEQELKYGVKKYEARFGCGIVMVPSTGKIKALGCAPSFDPQKYYLYKDKDFVNPLVTTVYEPGSTFKPLIVAMGIQEKKIMPKTVFDESGPYKIGEYYIRTWNNKYSGKINVAQILEKSSNVGMAQIIQKMDKKIVEKYLGKLGLRSKTNIEIQGEALSIIKQFDSWYPIDFATLSFGQGIAITPIQLVSAFSTLASDGVLRQPTIIDAMLDSQGNVVVEDRYKKQTNVFSKKTVKTMQKLLYRAVENSEAVYPQKPKQYKFCGKTGTAQIPIKGRYDANKTIASFIGFFPCINVQPKYLIFIMYREPKGSIWGSETAAPSFFRVAKRIAVYYNIAPNNTY